MPRQPDIAAFLASRHIFWFRGLFLFLPFQPGMIPLAFTFPVCCTLRTEPAGRGYLCAAFTTFAYWSAVGIVLSRMFNSLILPVYLQHLWWPSEPESLDQIELVVGIDVSCPTALTKLLSVCQWFGQRPPAFEGFSCAVLYIAYSVHEKFSLNGQRVTRIVGY